jgi:U3 small nucleolar RNA-associated protein 6
MAEQVQATLDQMVEPLQDLQQRNVFTPAEIHAIVERRRDYEYMLRRRNVRKVDCLKYVDDEVKLEQLRELRIRKIQREAREALQKLPREEREKQAQKMIKKHIGDRHVLQHIHSLWTRIFRKFRADQDLYLQYADFLKQQGAHGKLSQLYASVLAIFPRESAWWIRAASHEFFTNNNVQAARVMLQRGIRVNPKSNDLWVQSFVLELHFVQKIHGRRQLLELPKASKEDDDIYKLARLVHDNAILSAEDDGAVGLLMWQHCEYFPHTNELQQHILQALRKRCSDKPQAWIAMARCSLQSPSQSLEQNETNDDDNEEDGNSSESDHDEENVEIPLPPPKKKQKLEAKKESVLEILNEAIQSIPTSEMYVESVRFLRGIPMTESRRKLIEKIFANASAQDKVTVELLLEHVDFLEGSDQTKQALKKLRKYTANNKVSDARVWTRWAKIVFPNPEAATVLSKALKVIPMASSDHYMTVLLQLLGIMMALKRHNDCWALWEQVLLLAPGCQGLVDDATLFGIKSIADGCLQFLTHISSLKLLSDVRKIYEAVLFQSSMMDRMDESNAQLFKSFVETAIERERLGSDDNSSKKQRISRILDVALRKFQNFVDLADDLRQKREDALYG